MVKIKIVTDSTADLTREEIERYNIEVVPLTISIKGELYVDRVNISPSEFIVKMKESDELPKSSQPSSGTFLEVYDRFGSEGCEVLSIHMTGGMSGTVQSAESAAKMTNTNVTVIDSKFISRALSFQVIEAAKMAKQGFQIKEIVDKLDDIRKHTKLYVVVDTLENLVKGGRIGKGKAILGSLLNIKPIAMLEDGEYTPVGKVRSHSQAAKYIAKHMFEDIQGKKIKGIGLVHADGNELALKVKHAIKEIAGTEPINIQETSPIISTHTGPGAIGFMYYSI